MAESTLEIRVNGILHQASDPPGTLLIDFVRDSLGLKGTKRGCDGGECGSCTLLLDGEPVCACLCTLGAVSGRSVTTIEGIAEGQSLHAVQEAFMAAGAVQCGFCTPGMVLSAVALLRRHPRPGRDEIARYMNGNLCSCGSYSQVIEALESFAEASGDQ